MIKIIIYLNPDRQIEKIKIKGHAPLKHSFSIECAAISALSEVLCIGIKDVYKQPMVVKKKGLVEINIKEENLKLREEIEKYLFSFIIMFKKISEEFKDTVQLKVIP